MNRRGFSGLLAGFFGTAIGGVPPVPPVVGGGGALGSGVGASGLAVAVGAASKWAKRMSQLEKADIHLKALKLMGIIPQYILDDLWEGVSQDFHINRIPNDIKCLKSLSDGAKERIAKERAFKKAQDEWWDKPSKAIKRALWQKENPHARTWYNGPDSRYGWGDEDDE